MRVSRCLRRDYQERCTGPVSHGVDSTNEPRGALWLPLALGSDCQRGQPIPDEPAVIEIEGERQALAQQFLRSENIALFKNHISQAAQRYGNGPWPRSLPQ